MNTQVSVESGRLVFVPILRITASPMSDFCVQMPVPPGPVWVSILTRKHPNKAKKRQVIWVDVSRNKEAMNASNFVRVRAVSPILFVGDATFLYVDRRKSAEYERAVEAARSESKMCGAFRTDDGQVAACVRIGDKEKRLSVEIRDDGFRLTRTDPTSPTA